MNAIGVSGGNFGSEWYFPSYHRFHNLNLIFNVKPVQHINIYIHFGLASGMPSSRRVGDNPASYPVLMYDNNPHFIERIYWSSSNFTFTSDESNRTPLSFPLDIKFSIFGGKKNGKARYEMYIAVENIFALEYSTDENNRFNDTTIDKNSNFANFDMPIPIPSFGFKFSY